MKKFFLFTYFSCFIILIFFCSTSKANASYSYYRAITVTSSNTIASGTLSNFPMLVSSTLATWESTSTAGGAGHIQKLCTAPNGGLEPCDLVFATSSANCGTANLNFETEKYTSSTGALIDWVKVPSLSTGTVIYACYGNSSISTDQSHPSGTWDGNYTAVYHLADNAANTTIHDSTLNINNGTNVANTNTKATSTGEIDGAMSYNGSTDRTTTTITRSTAFTWETWFYVPNFGAAVYQSLMDIDGTNYVLMDVHSGSDLAFWSIDGLPGNNQGITSLSPNTWYHLVWTRSGDSTVNGYQFYLNGVASTPANTGSLSTGNTVTLGDRPDTAGQRFAGNEDEVRISGIVRSSQWILTEYNNQSSPATFYTMGSENSGNAVGYAWGNKMGWINFGTQTGNLQVLTTTVIGYAWSQNFGWINFAPSGSGVLNDGNGNLSGYAWSQGTGYINFSGVTINQGGVFQGIASGSVAGSIQFSSSSGCTSCNVTTAWTPTPIVPLGISAVNINGTNPASITLTPATTTNVTVSATITDNSCSQITAGTPTILLYRSGVTSSTCLTNPNAANCYVATSFTASSTCSSGSQNTTTTFPVQYYAQATDASSSFPNQNWIGTVLFTDSSLATSSIDSTHSTSSNVMSTMVALSAATSSINYGALAPGTNTSSTNQPVGVTNAGNATTTVQVSGTVLTHGANTITTSSQHYATGTFTFGGSEQLLSDTATTITGISIAPVIDFPITGAGWTKTTALPYADGSQTSVAYNGYLYTIGGIASTTSLAATTTVSFAPINATGSIGVWSSTKPLLYPVYYHTSVVYNGYVYAIGGAPNGGSATATVLFAAINATGSLNTWTSTQAMPRPKQYHSSVAYNGYIYTIGGTETGVNPTTTVLFAPINATGSLGVWTSTTALPSALLSQTSAVYNGYLYTIGGCPSSFCSTETTTVLFAPINATGSLGAWSTTTALPYQIDNQTSLIYNGYLYTIGGATAALTSTVSFAPINTNGSIGAWDTTQAMPYAVQAHSSAAYNGFLYTVAGDAPADTSTVLFAPLDNRPTYWGTSIPNNTPPGAYSGTNTFIAVFSN